jgi:uncharacterized protein (DUF1501 family)
VSDLEYEDIQQLLSIPAASIPGQMGRRRFLQGAVASAGALSFLPSAFDGMAAAATPVGPNDGILVVIQMGGGNDGLNMVPPRNSSRYQQLRGSLAITNPLPLTSALGLHPSLPKLKARYDAGKVAIVQGVGQTGNDRSHFSSTATWMAGTATSARTSGWLGRWLDGVPESSDGLRSVTIGASIPLHLAGSQAVTTALDTGGGLFGADRSSPTYAAAYDTISAFGAGPTGKGQWGDELARAGALAIDLAGDLDPLFTPALPNDSLTSQLTLVARLINANLGVRVLNTSFGSFDTHDKQLGEHQALLVDLDAAIDAFYKVLSPSWARRVTILTFSEFGRRASANASLGTDHGNSSNLLVIGDNVKGGLYGQAPDLDDLDNGDPRTHVDFRSVYASVLTGWLAADPVEIMGADYEDLGLFKGDPGEEVVGPITTGPWVPFATSTDLVRQQYRDFLGREGDASGVAYWAGRLDRKVSSIPQVIMNFLDSSEFGRSMAPVARLALGAFDAPPAFVDLTSWTAAAKSGTPLGDIADEITTKEPYLSGLGALATGPFVDAAYARIVGRAPTASARSMWISRIDGATHARGDLLVALATTTDAARRYQARVNVLMTYAGLLQRKPDPSGWTYWVGKTQSGTSIERLIAQFFTSSEYRRRFDPKPTN